MFLFQLRHLQTFAAENNSTIIFPVPIDILSNFMNFGNNNGMNIPPKQQPQPYQQYQPQTQTKVFQTSNIYILEISSKLNFNLWVVFNSSHKNLKKLIFILIQAPGTRAEDCSLKHLIGKEYLRWKFLSHSCYRKWN